MGTYVVRVSKVQSVNQLYGAVVANVWCESNISAWPVLDGPFVPRSAGGGRCRCGYGGGGGGGGGGPGGGGGVGGGRWAQPKGVWSAGGRAGTTGRVGRSRSAAPHWRRPGWPGATRWRHGRPSWCRWRFSTCAAMLTVRVAPWRRVAARAGGAACAPAIGRGHRRR